MLVLRVAVVVVVLTGGAVIVAAIIVQISGMSGDGDDQQRRKSERKEKSNTFANQNNHLPRRQYTTGAERGQGGKGKEGKVIETGIILIGGAAVVALMGAIRGAKTENLKLQAISVATAALVLFGNVLFLLFNR